MSDFEAVIETIRQAALSPEEWENVQKQTESYLGAIASQLASVDHARGNQFKSRTTEFPELDAHLENIAPSSEPVRFASENPNWRVFSDYDYISEEEMRHSFFYEENRKLGIGYRLALRLVDAPGLSKALVWLWRPQDGHPQRVEFEKVSRISEALRLAAHVASHLGEDFRAECGIVDALQGAGASAFLIEGDGRLVHANPAAMSILQAADGLQLMNGFLHIHQRTAKIMFEESCAQALNSRITNRENNIILAKRPSGLPPYFLTILPIGTRYHFLCRGKNLILILIDDPAHPARPMTHVLVSGFGLTKAEAYVTAALVGGASPAQIADQRGVSVETVREQLKTSMSKIGVRRQVELVRLFASIRRPD